MQERTYENADEIERIVKSIKPHLAGARPPIQIVALSDLVALWMAAMPPSLREEMIAMHIRHVRGLIRAEEKMLFGDMGHPESAGMTRQ